MNNFAYLLGALGDATIIYRKDKGEYRIEYEQKNNEWLENSIVPRINKLYKKTTVKKRKSGLFKTSLYSKQAYKDLKEFWVHPNLILSLKTSEQLCFVRGFFDAEGCVPKRDVRTAYRIYILQKDTKKLIVISKILKEAGIKTGKIEKNKTIFSLPVRSKAEIQKFSDLIKPEHPDKRRALENLLRS